ncbi:MAG: DUF4381 family protein [Verrucomicrobiaceae bacterium]|jgi:hypothetical protein|nr:DUF4381 domain-containing protein [Verrucomicrobiales bacterium]MDF1789778.1 DUF4381 domain-containing protein [Verrucomicrobiales bacterium]NCF84548.1 DUF4381 family protein [Verrucomicrobiaceae bacterium]NCF93183.1 DUF4381 family protein [Verrucomicrobiaceae bacterium]
MNEDAPSLPDILDIEPPLEVPPDPLHWSWWVLAVAVLLLIAGAIGWLMRRRQLAQISAKETALTDLSNLRARAPELDGYQFGVAVSDILRTYLTKAHNLRASQQTSREFLEELEHEKPFSEKRQDRLREFLQACDFLKYAPAGKATDPNQELLDQANFFIREDTV